MTKSEGLSGRLPFAEYVAAALIQVARDAVDGITNQPEKLPGVLHSHFRTTIDAEEIADAIEILAECGIAYVANDPLAGTFVRISEEKFDEFLKAVNSDKSRYYATIEDTGNDVIAFSRAEELPTPSWDLMRKYKVLQKYSEFGSPFVEAAMQRVGESDLQERLALGSDRLISFADNAPVVEEIREGLSRLEQELRTNNEVGAALGDARDEAISEINSLQTAMSGTQARAGYLLAHSRKVLGWIGRLAAKTSVEELVKHLIKLFIAWLN